MMTTFSFLVYLALMMDKTLRLRKNLENFYLTYNKELLFHGWHHILFVARKSVVFADEIGADKVLVEAAALTHDLNYIVDRKSEAEAGYELRAEFLKGAGFTQDEINEIENIVVSSSITKRDADISTEAQALSDADSLYKILPVSLVTFSSKYIQETGVSLKEWADRIIKYQRPLLDQGLYFYTESAKKQYTKWAEMDVAFVELIASSLDDPDIISLIEDSHNLGVL